MIHDIRVIFADTDQMGIVYYANYYRYFEAARAALLRAHGSNHKEMMSWGVALPVVESHCRYKSPAHYEDIIHIDIGVGEIRGASMRFVYQIHCEGRLLVEGYTVHACVHPDTGRPRRIPPQLQTLLESEPDLTREAR